MPRLLCATDLLPKSEAAIDRAGMLAEQLKAQLTLMHVVSPTTSERNLEQALQLAISTLNERARPPAWRTSPLPEVSVRAGNPSRLIIDAVDKHRINLLVVGPHRKRSIRDVLEGTIAEKILNNRQCPLLMVQKPAEGEYRQVLLALDVAEESGAAVRAAETLVLNARAQAMVMHVCEPAYQGMLRSAGVGTEEVISYVNQSRREAAAEIRDLLRQTSEDHTRYGVVIGDSHPARAIRRAVEMYQPDLLVMGTSGGRVRRALIGSVASQVMDAAGCDVLVVPRGSMPPRNASLH
jgi:nucleotide-binding universal stress UspA family protein